MATNADNVIAAPDPAAVFDMDPAEAKRLTDKLSPRERDVASHMALGISNPGIAEMLGISVKTLDVHRANVVRKLETHPQGVGRVWYCAKFATEE